MDYPPIEEHGIIGNLETAALINRSGAIDWCCLPHVESPSLFARLLDAEDGGHFTVQPATSFEAGHEYLDRTNVLETQFETASGRVTVTDFMPTPEIAEAGRIPQETIFRFVKQVASLAQKLTDAALIQLSHPAGNVVIKRRIECYRKFYRKFTLLVWYASRWLHNRHNQR